MDITDNVKRVAIVCGAILLLGYVLARFGFVTKGSAVIGALLAIALTAVVIRFMKTELGLPQTVATAIIVALCLLVLPKIMTVLWSPTKNAFYDLLPANTARALKARAVDTDLRTADRLQPVGTPMRAITAAYRHEREMQISRWYASELRKVSDRIGKPLVPTQWGWDEKNKKSVKLVYTEAMRVADEQRILREKTHNLAEVQKMRFSLPEDKSQEQKTASQPSASSSPNFTAAWNTAKDWAIGTTNWVKPYLADKWIMGTMAFMVLGYALISRKH
jgi:hypothetical protein